MYEYKLDLLKVIDGDTIDGYIDLGFNIKVKKRIRLLGINAPETRLQSKIKDISERRARKALGLEVKSKLNSLLKGSDVFVKTKLDKTGKYGRVLGVIFIHKDGLKININELLLSKGLVEKY
jgi:endonuclease YncB( thermonuclease family)